MLPSLEYAPNIVLPFPNRGQPLKLSPINIHHAVCFITSGKADTAVQAAKSLETILDQPVSIRTVAGGLKSAGLKAVVKKKKPFLSKKHKKARLDFALAHKDWTIEDWKRVVWSDETKINCLKSDGKKWV